MSTHRQKRTINRRGHTGLLLTLLALLAAAGCGDVDASDTRTAEVMQGPLTISVNETGRIVDLNKVVVKNKVPKSIKIVWLIDEGTAVKKGDLLVRLDTNLVEGFRKTFQIQVDNAVAAKVRAEKNLEITQNQADSDVARAKLDKRFSTLDLKKYVEGEYPLELKKAEAEITLAEEELKRASDKLEWSRQLADKGFLTRIELQADELALQRVSIELDQAKGRLGLLTQHTHTQRKEELEAAIVQAEMAVQRVEHKAKADIVQATAEQKAKRSELKNRQEELAEANEQLKNCEIRASEDGTVVYATTGGGHWRSRRDPLALDQMVSPEQEMIYLVRGGQMGVAAIVHESNLKKIKTGMPVRVRVDAVPGQVFAGVVDFVASYPTPQDMFKPNLTIYATRIVLHGNVASIKTGMSCQVETIIEEHKNALFVPIQTVVRDGRQTFAYVVGPDGVEKREVKIGKDNQKFVHILSGLKVGEKVQNDPPLPEDQPEPMPSPVADNTPQHPKPKPPTGHTKGTAPKLADMTKERLQKMSPEERMKWFQSLSEEDRKEAKKKLGLTRPKRSPDGA